jgi:hypothetical protein
MFHKITHTREKTYKTYKLSKIIGILNDHLIYDNFEKKIIRRQKRLFLSTLI